MPFPDSFEFRNVKRFNSNLFKMLWAGDQFSALLMLMKACPVSFTYSIA